MSCDGLSEEKSTRDNAGCGVAVDDVRTTVTVEITETEALIESLEAAKETSQEITAKVAIAKETEVIIAKETAKIYDLAEPTAKTRSLPETIAVSDAQRRATRLTSPFVDPVKPTATWPVGQRTPLFGDAPRAVARRPR